MRVSLVVALAENGVIGRGGTLPWHLPADLKRFKAITLGHTLLMGRRTYESIGRLLPGRSTVILSQNAQYRVPGALVAPSLEAALAQLDSHTELFVVGGAAVYASALPRAERLFVTLVEAPITGDVFFPQVNWAAWRLTLDEPHAADDQHALAFRFRVYERLPNLEEETP